MRVQNGVEHEFYERNLEEAGVDGFLMLAMTESDLVDVACVDSVAARRRLVRAVLERLDAEGRTPNSWPAVLAKAQVLYSTRYSFSLRNITADSSVTTRTNRE